MEWSSGESDKFNIGQQFQECLRPLLLQRYGQQKLISCRSTNLQLNCTTTTRPTTKISPLVTCGRVDYKVAVLCYKAVKLQQPSYLTCLRSSSTVIYVRPTVNTVFIDKHCWSSVLMLRHHRLEQSSLICMQC